MLTSSTAVSGDEASAPRDPAHASALAGETATQRRKASASPLVTLATWWRTTLWLPITVLAGVTAITAVVSEVLVSTIEPLTHQIGLSPFFVGLIILPIVGNAAEHYSAITSATRNHMEISMAITAGSSIQIALLAAPILVLAGPLIGVPLDLNFSLLEVALFALVTGLYALISLDGEFDLARRVAPLRLLPAAGGRHLLSACLEPIPIGSIISTTYTKTKKKEKVDRKLPKASQSWRIPDEFGPK